MKWMCVTVNVCDLKYGQSTSQNCYVTDIMCDFCYAESHKENSQPHVQEVADDNAKQPSLYQAHRIVSSPVSQSNADKEHHEAPVKRPSIFGSVALLAESSTTTPSRSVGHRLPSSASPFTVASNVDGPQFATPPYTPRSRSQPAAATATPLASQQQQQQLSRVDDFLMTPPSLMTPDNHQPRQHGLHMTYTPPFTPVRPATTTPVGRPRSRLSLNCPSPLQDLTRPPSASLALVSLSNS